MTKYVSDEKPAEPDHTKSANAASFASTSSQGISLSAQAEPGDVDLNGLDEEQELDDDLWEEVDTEEEEMDQKRMEAAHEMASSSVMDIEESEGISLQAPGLLDLLSDSPISGTLTNQVNEIKLKESKKIKTKGPKVFHVSDIQF